MGISGSKRGRGGKEQGRKRITSGTRRRTRRKTVRMKSSNAIQGAKERRRLREERFMQHEIGKRRSEEGERTWRRRRSRSRRSLKDVL